MKPGSHTQTLLFSRPGEAIAAIKVLGRAGMEVSRISIQTWGRRIALRPRDAIEQASLRQIVALGGEVLPEPGSRRTVEVVDTIHRHRLEVVV